MQNHPRVRNLGLSPTLSGALRVPASLGLRLTIHRGRCGWEEPCTVHPKTLNLEPPTLNLQPSTLNPRTSTLNSQPSILNPQPSTLNPQPSSLNPQPSTLNPTTGFGGDLGGRVGEAGGPVRPPRLLHQTLGAPPPTTAYTGTSPIRKRPSKDPLRTLGIGLR